MSRPAQESTALDAARAFFELSNITYRTTTNSGGDSAVTIVVTSEDIGGYRDFFLRLVFDASGALVYSHRGTQHGGTGLWEE